MRRRMRISLLENTTVLKKDDDHLKAGVDIQRSKVKTQGWKSTSRTTPTQNVWTFDFEFQITYLLTSVGPIFQRSFSGSSRRSFRRSVRRSFRRSSRRSFRRSFRRSSRRSFRRSFRRSKISEHVGPKLFETTKWSHQIYDFICFKRW